MFLNVLFLNSVTRAGLSLPTGSGQRPELTGTRKRFQADGALPEFFFFLFPPKSVTSKMPVRWLWCQILTVEKTFSQL